MRETVFWVCAVLLTYAYVGYPVVVWLIARVLVRRRFTGSGTELPSVSILIPAYNEERNISQKLRNCLSLSYPNDRLEVLVGSDGATDGTVRIARRYASTGKVSVVELVRKGKSNVLNELSMRAKGSILVLTDANTEIHTESLLELVKPFENPDVGCVCGCLHVRSSGQDVGSRGESLYWRYETFIKRQEGAIGCLAGANGGFYALRREEFGRLPVATVNDDFVLSMAVILRRRKMTFAERAVAEEMTAGGVRAEFRRHIRDSAGHYQAVCYLWRLLNPALGLPFLCFVSHRILRWLGPALLLGAYVSSALLSSNPLYFWMFMAQSTLYVAAAVVTRRAARGHRLGLFGPAYYFVLLNAALLVGFVRWASGRQSPTWEPERDELAVSKATG